MTDFRLCSICQSFSQAGIVLLRSLIGFIQFEPAFVRLRYFLGGDRPSQTTHYKLFKIMSNKSF